MRRPQFRRAVRFEDPGFPGRPADPGFVVHPRDPGVAVRSVVPDFSMGTGTPDFGTQPADPGYCTAAAGRDPAMIVKAIAAIAAAMRAARHDEPVRPERVATRRNSRSMRWTR